MRLVAVSVVKNEADVIEAFVRHTAALVDQHLVFDHASTDGTREILCSLQEEGFALSLYEDDALLNLQQHRSNHLVRLAADDCGADWILPLDADEFLVVPNRPALECALADHPTSPARIPLLDYCLCDADDPAELNPAHRHQHATRSFSSTHKLVLPRAVATDAALTIGKGSHAVTGPAGEVPSAELPNDFFLAHLSQRSPAQQAVRLITAELQKIARGRRHAAFDVHYRLGFQLLAENPALFAQVSRREAKALAHRPIGYRGGRLRYTTGDENSRVARALLPFLEALATSHGRLVDELSADDHRDHRPEIRPLHQRRVSGSRAGRTEAFAGFTANAGWSAREGPIAASFLPPFHWGLAPETRLTIEPFSAGLLTVEAEALTYVGGQTLEIVAGGAVVFRHVFSRVYQKENLRVTFQRPSDDTLLLRYGAHLPPNTRDPRALAVIFLSLHISPGAAA